MRTVTQPRRRGRNATATATATATDNQYTALVSDLDSDSDPDSDTDSLHSLSGISDTDSELSAVNHIGYQASVLAEIRLLEQILGYIQEEDSDYDDDSYDDDDETTMIITPESLEALCSSSLTPLKEWDSVQVQQIKVSIINGLIRVPSETHDHGHGYVLENEEYFRQ